ncbi:MAG: restriction endonuclease subunit S [archaeon]
MRYVYKRFNDLRELNSLLQKTQYGFTESAASIGKYKLLRITDLKNGKVNWDNVPYCDGECEHYLLKKGDIVIARTGNNKSFLISEVPDNTIFASYLIRLETNEKLLPDYLNIFLNSYLFWNQVIDMQTGTAIPNVNAQKLRTLKIPYCNIQEQKKIIDVFNKISNDKNYQFLTKDLNKINLKIDYFFEFNNKNLETQNLNSKLHQAILQEAVSGKLIPQNINDEPASELLKKIKVEKERLIRGRKIKKINTLSQLSEENIPYELPKGWVWVRLGEICQTSSGGTPSRSNSQYWGGKIPWLKSGELNDNLKINKCEEYITEEGLKNSSAKLFKKGSLVLALYGATAGKLGILDFDTTTNQAVCNIEQNSSIDTMYLFYFLRSNRDKILNECFGGAQPNISQDYVQKIKFPLPPLSEQKRIVEKANHLMQLCDELESKFKENQKNSELLMEVVLKEAFEK